MWNFQNLVKNSHGITERLHVIDPRTTELSEEQYEELRKALQLYWYRQDRMKNGGLLLRNATAVLRNI